MSTSKVVEYIDIAAPREEIFELILNLKRRMQLSPLWGFATLLDISPEFPQEGSSYRVKPNEGEHNEYVTIITEYQPLQKLAYRLTADTQTTVCWTVQEVAQGTRIIYEEEFLIGEEQDKEVFVQSVKKIVSQWLKNIKNYSELRGSRTKRAIRWFLDRYFLKLRKDQRNVIITILFMQFVAMISFVMAAIALGIAGGV
jgi:hypothetical protein